MTDKTALLQRLIHELEEELRTLEYAQRTTQEGAVHPEAKQEGDKDTRASESQYLARGLAMRVEELRESIAALQTVTLRTFGEDDPVALTALVTLEDDEGRQRRYLLAPAAGGRRLDAVAVITTGSPIGQALVGKRVGDDVVIRTPKGERQCELTDVV